MSLKKVLSSLVFAAQISATAAPQNHEPAKPPSYKQLPHKQLSHKHLSKKQQQELQQLMAVSAVQSGAVGQSVMVLRNEELVYSYHVGTTALNSEQKVDADTIFPVYSVTKLFIAALITNAVEQKQLSPAHPVRHYLAFLPEHWQEVRVEHLLSHSSGLPEFHGTGLEQNDSVEEIMAFLKTQPMAFPINSQVRYNQTNFLLLKLILEKLHRKPLPSILADEFTKPFGMTRTTYGVVQRSFETRTSHYLTYPENRVYHYYARENGQLNKVEPIAFSDTMYAATGLNASGTDVAHWFSALLSGQYIPVKALTASWQPALLSNGVVGEYSNGWQVLKDIKASAVGHYGGNFINVRHFFLNEPDADSVTVVHLNNGGFHADFSPFDFSYDVARVINPRIELGSVDFKREVLELAGKGELSEIHLKYKRFLQDPLRQTQNTEGMINELGYQLLDKAPNASVLLFQLNLMRYPNSANAHDSYAEGLYRIGNYTEARRYYTRAYAMAPEYEHIPLILEELELLFGK